jgi:alpha 1,3-glucosidase
MRTFLRLVLLIITLTFILAVDRSKFRKCSDTGFCRRYRDKSASNIRYTLNLNSVRIDERGRLSGVVHTSQSDTDELRLLVSGCETGAIRLQLIESKERWAPTDLLTTKATTSWPFTRLTAGDSKLPEALRAFTDEDIVALAFHNPSSKDDSILAIYPKSLVVELYQGGELVIRANARNLMHFELSGQASNHRLLSTRNKEDADIDRHAGKEVVDYGEDGLALYKDGTKEVRVTHSDQVAEPSIHGDNFGGHKDSQINGPVSVGMDFSFPFAQNVYGIPEHSSPLSLPSTTRGSSSIVPHYSEPYRLYNLDVFEYELDQTMSLYGNIPLLLAHGIKGGKGQTAGVFWFNPSETFVDITDEELSTGSAQHKASHWISESGNIDVFFLPGPSPNSVYSQFTSLTGTQQLPPMFSLGYHQCRWNYRDERDIAQVESTFEQLDYPVDVLWLDIEHTDGKRYFTWDKSLFPNPIEMQRNVSRHGRKMVTIVDPHIKRDSHWNTHAEATSLGYYIKDSHGGDFDGWCWPGSSSYLDFTAEKVRKWWADRFSLDKYIGSTMDLFTWNDMNEPSVFNGPEVSMPKDAKNLEGIEHREWHNLYGIYMQMATALGLQSRAVPTGADQQRPFVLTRAFWAGSQRYGAMWTGDNTADWGHLKISVPMLLSINLAGLSFAGADVGGFFGEPSAELFTRWYQAGSFTPFFRGHAHLDTKRREPWVFGEPYTGILRKAAMLRYTLLPYWYTTFFHAYDKGLPVMRTMWSEFPNDIHALTLQNQWMVGASLLVVPVTDPGKTSVPAYLPPGSKWYHLDSLKEEAACSGAGEDGGRVILGAPLEHIPVLIRGGSIVPRKMRLRRSSKLMFYDPYTLVVAPDAYGEAFGNLYLDDEITLAHETRKIYALRRFTFRSNVLTCEGTGVYEATNTVERIVIAGIAKVPKRVILRESSQMDSVVIDLVFFYDEANRVVTVKKPDVRVDQSWTIMLEV